jgi:hypothetical protein
LNVIKILLAAEADIEAREMMTLLPCTCANMKTVRTLLNAHADIEVMNKVRHTLTDVVRKEQKTAVHQMLIAVGAHAHIETHSQLS